MSSSDSPARPATEPAAARTARPGIGASWRTRTSRPQRTEGSRIDERRDARVLGAFSRNPFILVKDYRRMKDEGYGVEPRDYFDVRDELLRRNRDEGPGRV